MAPPTTYFDIPGLLHTARIDPPKWMVDTLRDSSLRYIAPSTDELAQRVLTATSQDELDQAGNEYSQALARADYAEKVNEKAEQRGKEIIRAAFTPDRMLAVADQIIARYAEVAVPFVEVATGVHDVVDTDPQYLTVDMLATRDALMATGEPLKRVRTVWQKVAPLCGVDLESTIRDDLGFQLLSMAEWPSFQALLSAADFVGKHRQNPRGYLFSGVSEELAVVTHRAKFRLVDAETADDARVQLYRASSNGSQGVDLEDDDDDF